ncbi:hypothetical protein RFI_11402 [Reticulomyxa filosa]|uniref:Uncharacterized protein n=1 Tax=Reticulomyxa filosa TaxID=46433 RepID=X6NHD3_RETFI|nr:hypothetical protein RFI_11402 [Reticulomyxa filosa]|eukprot:ETO25735.1 hypothetical protein RFI_11402 [Reticulomyxa filosa]
MKKADNFLLKILVWEKTKTHLKFPFGIILHNELGSPYFDKKERDHKQDDEISTTNQKSTNKLKDNNADSNTNPPAPTTGENHTPNTSRRRKRKRKEALEEEKNVEKEALKKSLALETDSDSDKSSDDNNNETKEQDKEHEQKTTKDQENSLTGNRTFYFSEILITCVLCAFLYLCLFYISTFVYEGRPPPTKRQRIKVESTCNTAESQNASGTTADSSTNANASTGTTNNATSRQNKIKVKRKANLIKKKFDGVGLEELGLIL